MDSKMKWNREVFNKTTRYTSECDRYLIVRDRILSSKTRYTLYLNDDRGTYLGTFYSIDFAKRNAERHTATGRLIGASTPIQ